MNTAARRATDSRSRESADKGAFRLFNSFAEPIVRAGFGSTGWCHAGVIVIETKGRRTGKPHRTPVVAGQAGGHIWVSTALGARSDWLTNAQRNSDVRYWLAGEAYDATAFVFGPDGLMPDTADLPPVTRAAATSLSALVGGLGLAFAILVPKPQA